MNRQLVWFFALAFAWTWAFQIPLVAGLIPAHLTMVVLGLGAIGPSLAALAIAWGHGGIAQLFRRSGTGGIGWFAVALILPVAIGAVAAAIAMGVGAPAPAHWLRAPAIGVMVLPAIGEELGWRGFAYPNLAARLGKVTAAVAVGGLWALWHLPTAFLPGATLVGFVPFAIAVTGAGVWIAWLYERGGRNVWVAVVAHGAINAHIISLPPGDSARIAFVVVNVLVGAACAFSLARTAERASPADLGSPRRDKIGPRATASSHI